MKDILQCPLQDSQMKKEILINYRSQKIQVEEYKKKPT